MEVKLRVVGSSPAWPNPGGAQSGYLVELDGRRLLLDCGAGVLARLREREPWPRVDAIAITHFHLDHYADLVSWVWGMSFGPGRDVPRPELWISEGSAPQLAHLGMHFGREDMFAKAFELHEYREREPFETAGLTVVPYQVMHYELRTFGFRIEANGRVFAYSGDSAPSDALAELARDADLFVCEATLAASEEADPPGHLSLDEALAAFRASRARRLVLTHRPHELAVDDGLELAYDGFETEI